MYLTQTEAAKMLGVSRAWLFLRREDSLYAPALRLPAPRFHPEQIRLWLAVASGNLPRELANAEWELLRAAIGRKPFVPHQRKATA